MNQSTKTKESTAKSEPKKKANKDLDNDMPFIKSNPKANSLEIEQVREAMTTKFEKSRSGIPLFHIEWMTPCFLEAIEKSPVLSKAFSNPAFIQMTNELVKDPAKTFKQCAESRPDWLNALKEFSKLLGETFSKKADEQEAAKLNEFEQKLIEKALNDPQVKEALCDSRVQKLLENLRKNSVDLNRFMFEADSEMRKKINSLIQCGLLQIQNK